MSPSTTTAYSGAAYRFSDSKILYIAEKYSNIGKVKSITGNISTMGMYSIDNIIDAIKNY